MCEVKIQNLKKNLEDAVKDYYLILLPRKLKAAWYEMSRKQIQIKEDFASLVKYG